MQTMMGPVIGNHTGPNQDLSQQSKTNIRTTVIWQRLRVAVMGGVRDPPPSEPRANWAIVL